MSAPSRGATGRWAAGLTVSLLANAGLAGAAWIAVRPDPPPPPEPFEARVSLETRAVPDTHAPEAEAGGDALHEAAAPAPRAASAAVRESRAAPLPVDEGRLRPLAPPAPVETASTPPPMVTPVAASGMRPLSLAPAVAVSPVVQPPATMAAAARPAGILSAAAPASERLSPRTDAVAAVRPAVAASPTAPAAAVRLAARPATQVNVADTLAAYVPSVPFDAALAVPAAPTQVPIAAALPALAAQPLSAGRAEGPRAVEAPAPAAAAVPVPPRGDSAAAADAAGPAAGALPPGGDPAPAIPPPAEKGTARLAWTSGAAIADPVSLAAVQSFMRAAAPPEGADSVRDGLAAALSAPPCSRLQTRYDPDTGTLELRGHVPEDALRGPLLATLAAEVGAGIPVADRMRILPRPVCGALAGIAAVGLPQSTEQDTDPRIVGADTHVRAYDYRAGQRLVLDLAGPDYDAFVYVDYFAADGTVIHLEPNGTVPLRRVAADAPFRVGEGGPDRPSLDLTVAPPFGQEIAAAFAASRPLYEGLRPVEEPAEPYLEFLRAQVAAARADDPNFKGEWVYVFVATAP